MRRVPSFFLTNKTGAPLRGVARSDCTLVTEIIEFAFSIRQVLGKTFYTRVQMGESYRGSSSIL